MQLTNRLEKLRFIIQEMDLALFLARRIPQDDLSRNIARHVIVRAFDFIAHSRQLKKPLLALGYRVTEFHEQKESFAKTFDEYFLPTRHRMAAHVQDLDFWDRLEFWNALEVQKLEYLVEAAQDIYIKILGSFGIAEYVTYACLPDQDNPELLKLLNAWSSIYNPIVLPELGSDVLAMSRPGSVAMLNFSPVHTRAGQLVMIHRWVEEEEALLAHLGQFADCERILRARLLTDVVSYADILITRSDAGALQSMEGLDKILPRTAGEKTSSIIPRFLACYRYQETLAPFRKIRDHVGGHLDIDEDNTLAALLAQLGTLSLSEILGFFQKLAAVFAKLCRSASFLIPYQHRRTQFSDRVVGIEINDSYTPFDESRPPPIAAKLNRSEWSREEAQRTLEQWIAGGEQHESARMYFYDMFAHSAVVETLYEVKQLGTRAIQHRSHNFTVAHQFVLECLVAEKSHQCATRMLELLIHCRSGYPYALLQVILRYHRSSGTVLPPRYLYRALGQIRSRSDEAALELLRRGASSQNWADKYEALMGLFLIFLHSEGIDRVNKHGSRSYAHEVGFFLDPLSKRYRLILLLSFASHLSLGAGSSYLRVFKAEQETFHQDILRNAARLLQRGPNTPMHDKLRKLLSRHDYAGVALVVGDGLTAAGKVDDAKSFYSLRLEGSHGSAATAYCALKLKSYEEALAHADLAVRLHPEEPLLQLVKVEILMETPGRQREAKQLLDELNRQYVFIGEDKKSLDEFNNWYVFKGKV